MNNKQFSLLFYPGGGIAGALVRYWTGSPYAHVAIKVSGSIFGNEWYDVYEAVATGVRMRRFDIHGADKDAAEVTIPGAGELSAASVEALNDFLGDAIGKPYDWFAVVFDVLGRFLPVGLALDDNRRCAWDCSRLAAAALTMLGWTNPRQMNIHAPVSPGDLYTLLTV